MRHKIEWVHDGARFAALEESWGALVGPAAVPFDRHCWYMAWWNAFGHPDALALCTAWRDGALVAVLPLTGDRLGHRLWAMANVHTPAFRPLARDDAALQVVLTAALDRARTSLELTALDADDPCIATINRLSPERAGLRLVEHEHVSPIVDTAGAFEDWVKETRPRWRTNIPRLRRKMAREYDTEIRLLETPSDLERDLEEGFRIEASGWKGRTHTAILSSEHVADFYREVARVFQERGELRLSRVVLDGQGAAFDFCLLADRRLYLLKTGFDERFRKLAPGLVLRLATIERCFGDGLDAHELLGHAHPWKDKFATSEQVHLALRLYSRRPTGAFHYSYRAWGRPRLKQVYDWTLARNRGRGKDV